MAFHFWDATDDFSATDMDLLFEGHRLYLLDARGRFGAVPMSMTGALTRVQVYHIYQLQPNKLKTRSV